MTKVIIDEYVLDGLFNYIPETPEKNEVWWRETTEGDGYIMVWADGTHFHTYRYPPDWY